MRMLTSAVVLLATVSWLARGTCFADDPTPIRVQISADRLEGGAVLKTEEGRLSVTWPIGDEVSGRITFRLVPGSPLIESLGTFSGPSGDFAPIVEAADPAVFLTVGSREQGRNRPPTMSVFNEFFDNPASRPSSRYSGKLTLRAVRVETRGPRTTIAFGDLEAGPFRGEWRFTVFVGERLIQVEAVLKTDEDRRAFVYDAGLAWNSTQARRIAWTDTEGRRRAEDFEPTAEDRAIAVRHRAIALGAKGGSLVVTPPPHQFFFPRDYTDNVRTTWAGRGHFGTEERFGLGIRQDVTGGGNFVPWFNAPPGTDQHLGMFLLLGRGTAETGLDDMLRYTRGDRFAEIPGRVTFTSHYHMAITVAAMKAASEDRSKNPMPAFVRMFQDMGVNAVHLGEFHGDGHQYDPGPLRLPELRAMFAECRRLSDAKLLFLPGEEVARFLGHGGPGRESGHWMTLFPRPVQWILDRKPGQPFEEQLPEYGIVYRVGNAEDVQKVLEREHGLAWTAHPRIKSSSWAPDAFRTEPYYLADTWLGAAWKAMPADLSLPRLGRRGLDLLDDMANWGGKKYLIGEVDVFKLDPSHELYGHMNINYLELDRLPSFDDSWQPILDCLRGGHFFTTTGEVLIREFRVGGVASGATLTPAADDRPELQAEVEWTYPLRFAEVISGDGEEIYRERIDLEDTESFGKRTIRLKPELKGRKWVRLEVWDVAANGAYTQPVWIEGK